MGHINDLKLFFHLTTILCDFVMYVMLCTSLYFIVRYVDHLYVICTSSVTFYLLGYKHKKQSFHTPYG